MSALKLSTPIYHHLTEKDFDHIYPPAEDSFLLIDALEKDLTDIKVREPKVVVELGIGSGIVITALAMELKDTCCYFGIDINDYACQKAKETAKLNGATLETFCGDLISPLPNKTNGYIDILIFNPPYVVTDTKEIGAGDLEHTWAGGVKGREVIDRLLPFVHSILSPNGVFYLLLEKNNQPSEVIEIMKQNDFGHEVVIQRRAANEQLYVIKFFKNLL